MTLVLNIGVQKAGTSTVFEVLRRHSGINTTKYKESGFFCVDGKYEKGKSYYLSEVFSNDNDGPLLDIDPEFIFDKRVPGRIFDLFGSDVKIFAILRDPAMRAFSEWNMETYRGNETRSFHDAIEDENNKRKHGTSETTYLSRGYYTDQLKNYLAHFPAENIKVYIFENEFINAKQDFYKDICNFINIEWDDTMDTEIWTNQNRRIKSQFVKNIVRHNNVKRVMRRIVGAKYALKIDRYIQYKNAKLSDLPKLSDEERVACNHKYFIDDINSLSALISKDLSNWLKIKN